MYNLLKLHAVNFMQRGFTLIEIAIVMVILGVILTPAAALYHQYRVNKDWESVKDDLREISNSIGLYRSIYGRYPVPSATNSAPGDTGYGFEVDPALIPAVGTCANGLCMYQNAASGRNVLIGSLPYKTLNLQETQSIDSGKNRYTYAVTLVLTDNTSFDLSAGGIGVFDSMNPAESLVSPAGSAHFVVLSHGSNGAGAYSRSGSIGAPCTSGTVLEQENCDADSDFMAGSYHKETFDDHVTFFTSVYPSEWQISADDDNAIHLKNTDSMAIGANMSEDLSSSKQTTVRTVTSNTGSIYASSNFVSEKICPLGGASSGECFEPELIAGELNHDGTLFESQTTGEGMSCYDPATGEQLYMAGISNSGLLCTDEIFSVCPKHTFVSGIGADGKVKCAAFPGYWCPDEEKTLSCLGKTATMAQIHNGGYRAGYSGECSMAPDYDEAYFAAKAATMSDFTEFSPLIAAINAEPKTVGDCGTDTSDPDTQVKDIYRCNNGTWNFHRRIERGYYYNSMPASVSSTQYAEIPSDCTCNEYYRVEYDECPPGYNAGARGVSVYKYPCPRTYSSRRLVYRTPLFCGCQPGPFPKYTSCNSWYNTEKPTTGTNGLEGSVTLTYQRICVNEVPVELPDPIASDTSGCSCKTANDNINRTSCPFGNTNSWSWTDIYGIPHAETAIELVKTRNWMCPGTTITDRFGSSIPDPAYYGAWITHGPEACACDTNKTGIKEMECDVFNMRGAGRVYERKWDCTLNGGLGGWEPMENWILEEDNCNGCTWQTPIGSHTLEDVRYGGHEHEIGRPCSCNTDTTTPHCNFPEDGKYKIWTSCPCREQSN